MKREEDVMSSAKHFTEVLIGGKVYTLSGFEGEEYLQKVSSQGDSLENDIELKDKEMYDLKHELISAQIKLENAEKELAKIKDENNDLQMQIVKLETEMKNRRR